jgi:hypothetical protein
LSTNLRPEKLYCAGCGHLIHNGKNWQPYTSNADFSKAHHSTQVGCLEAMRLAGIEEFWRSQGLEPDVVY